MADETDVQTDTPVEAVAAPEPSDPNVQPGGEGPVDQQPAPADISDEPAPEPALEPVEQDTSPPVVDTEAHHFLTFRQLWNGGERRAAYALVQAGQFAEDEFSALLNEFPDILKIINS